MSRTHSLCTQARQILLTDLLCVHYISSKFVFSQHRQRTKALSKGVAMGFRCYWLFIWRCTWLIMLNAWGPEDSNNTLAHKADGYRLLSVMREPMGTGASWSDILFSYTAVALFCGIAENNYLHLLQQFPQDHTEKTSKTCPEPATWGISCLEERNKYLYYITTHLNLVFCHCLNKIHQ